MGKTMKERDDTIANEKHQDQMLTLRSTPVWGKGMDRREAGQTAQLLSS